LSDPRPTITGYDPFDPDVLEDPYPWYAWLRSEAPAYHVAEHDVWVLSRYDDVVHALRDPATFSSNEGVSFERRPVPMLIAMDPPDHTRLRRLVARTFTPRAVASWAPRIDRLIDEILDRAFDAGDVDVVTAVSEPLPVTVIAEMMGVPVERQADFRRWSDATIETTGGVISAENEALIMELAEFFHGLIAERRAAGDHGGRDDLISVLFGETPDGDRLGDAEILAFCVLLLVAGNETTTNLISNAVDTLLDRPDQWRAVVDRPELIPSLVEESLRWVSPVQGLYRNTLAPAEVAGSTIPAGAKVLVLYASANRDAAHWPDADEFRVDRYPTGTQGADHLAFGNGIHLCLGSHLARLEASLLAEKLVARLGRLERTGDVVRGRNPSIRAVKHLPVAMTPR
jgi:cytochrome P450